ncbi:MAG: T9SS type A sorting domain-containing protein [Putridiphycobacter sp.]
MKKTLLFVSLFAFGAVNAQFVDDIESYSLGPVHQNHWTSWSGSPGSEDAIATAYRANSGSQSMQFLNTGAQDCILDLVSSTGGTSNITSGQWTVEFKMYIPSDSGAYYNFQEIVPIGTGSWGLEIFYGDTSTTSQPVVNGQGAIKATTGTGTQAWNFNFPNDSWFTVTHFIDVDNDSINIVLDGTSVYHGPAYTNDATGQTYGALAGVDFYSASSAVTFYVDDVNFTEGYLTVEDVQSLTNLSVYPNPVVNELNVVAEEVITAISVYDMMGKLVATYSPNASNLVINTSDYAEGTYMVKVETENTSKTIKVVK